MIKIIIDEHAEGLRIDRFLADFLSDFSRSKIQNSLKKGDCLVNDLIIKPSYILKEGDVLEYNENNIKKDLIIIPEDLKIQIVWEDDNMAVVNKPSGMLSHPTIQETTGTLVNALKFIYGENLSDINGEFRRGIIHRLDRNTSGLIMIAKNNKTHDFLVSEMKNKRFNKKYVAIVRGVIEKDSFVIDSPLGRHLTQPHKQAVRKDGKEAITIVNVLKRFENASLVELDLITGRTHQIRVHLSSIGYPVYNDTLYGFGKMKIKTEEQVLQSYKLEFTKPFTSERIHLEIPFDEKVDKVLSFLTT